MSFAMFVRHLALKRNIMMCRPVAHFNVFTYRLMQAKRRGLSLNSAIDGGAARGEWAIEFKKVYPDAQVLCVEPRDKMQPVLNEVAAKLPGVKIAKALLGAAEGEAKFFVSEDQSSMLPDHKGAEFGVATVQPVTTIDKLVETMNFPGPDFIKLDLQGAELLALDGAQKAMQRAQMIQLELSTLQVQVGCPLMIDVMKYLDDRGFALYDIVALQQRPLDTALAQLDALFVPKNHPLRADGRWSKEMNP